MEVKISFDTEKESIDDLKRLVITLQDLIEKKEKSSSLANPLASQSVKIPSQIKIEKIEVQQTTQPVQAGGQTAGGGKIIPYEDMSGTLSKIISGKKYR